MREFEHKRKFRKILSSPFVLVPLAIIVVLLVRGTWNIYLKDRDSVAQLIAAQERLAKLESRQEQLSVATVKLSSDAGVESEIRDRFQMAKKGEKEIVIVENSAAGEQKVPVKKSFFQRIFDFFTTR